MLRSEAFPRIFHCPGARLTHSQPAVSQEIPVLGSLAPRPLQEGQRQARSCCCTLSLRCRGFNVEQIKQCVFVQQRETLVKFVKAGFAGKPMASCSRVVKTQMQLSKKKKKPHLFADYCATLACTSWLDPDWLTKVSAQDLGHLYTGSPWFGSPHLSSPRYGCVYVLALVP